MNIFLLILLIIIIMENNKLRDTLISTFANNFKINDGKYIGIIRDHIADIFAAIKLYQYNQYSEYFIISISNTGIIEYYITKNGEIIARFNNNSCHYNIIFNLITNTITITSKSGIDIFITDNKNSGIYIGNKQDISCYRRDNMQLYKYSREYNYR
jgi:hypothetical protein